MRTYIEVITPPSVLKEIEKAEQVISEHEDSKYMRERTTDMVWHTRLNPNNMGVMRLLGTNSYNEFFGLDIAPSVSTTLTLYTENENDWIMLGEW